MDVRALRAFLAVVDLGSFTAAAQALFVTQPAVSQTVRGLERSVGQPLFERLGREVVLTPAGHALVPEARQVLRSVRSARAAVDAVAGLESGTLELACLPTLSVEPTAPWIGAFRRDHPGVSVVVEQADSVEDGFGLLRSGRVELLVTEAEAEVPGFEHRVELTQSFAFVGPNELDPTTLDLREVAAMPMVTGPAGTSTRLALERVLATVGATPNVAVETTTREALIPLVVAGAGVTLLPEPLARRAVIQGARRIDLPDAVSRTVSLVQRTGPGSPAAEAFASIAAALATASAATAAVVDHRIDRAGDGSDRAPHPPEPAERPDTIRGPSAPGGRPE